MDILCQAKSGMGKTAVFVLATLQQIEPVDGQVRPYFSQLYVWFLAHGCSGCKFNNEYISKQDPQIYVECKPVSYRDCCVGLLHVTKSRFWL